jgi:UDP-glucose-4-epimerase GalE
MKKFVVTGASGYIGSHMCYELRKAYPDCFIIAIDKHRKHKLDHLYDVFDLRDISKTNANLFEFHKGIDCIFHFAALAVVPESEEKPYTYYRNNVLSTVKMMDEAIHYGVKNFVFSSTCAVYGTPKSLPISESEKKKPESVYAASKSIAEDILLAAEKEHGVRVSLLRYFNAAGRSVEANLYEEHEPETHLIPNLIKHNKVTVYGNTYDTPDGTAVRDYIHVIDLCRAHIKAYEYMEKNDKGIVCNLGTGQGHSVMEVIDKVEVTQGKSLLIEFKPRRNGDLPILYSDTTKMRNDLQFLPEHDIVSIIESMRN